MRQFFLFSLLFFWSLSLASSHNTRSKRQRTETACSLSLSDKKRPQESDDSDSSSPLSPLLHLAQPANPTVYHELLKAAFTPREKLPSLPLYFVNARIAPSTREGGPLCIYTDYSIHSSLPYFAQQLQTVNLRTITEGHDQDLRLFHFLMASINLFTLRSGLKYIETKEESSFDYDSVTYADRDITEEQRKLITRTITLRNLVTDISFYIDKLDNSYGFLTEFLLNQGHSVIPDIEYLLAKIIEEEITLTPTDPTLKDKMERLQTTLNPSFWYASPPLPSDELPTLLDL